MAADKQKKASKKSAKDSKKAAKAEHEVAAVAAEDAPMEQPPVAAEPKKKEKKSKKEKSAAAKGDAGESMRHGGDSSSDQPAGTTGTIASVLAGAFAGSLDPNVSSLFTVTAAVPVVPPAPILIPAKVRCGVLVL